MIDEATKKRIEIERSTGIGMPSITLLASQVGQVEAVLKSAGVLFWVSPWTASFDNRPKITRIQLSRNTDLDAAQKRLDDAG